MSKKFSMKDWVYPDGDPVEQYDKRVLDTFCDLPATTQSLNEVHMFDVSKFLPTAMFKRTFLGIFEGSDLWLAISIDTPSEALVVWIQGELCDSEFIKYITTRPRLIEAKRRAIDRGLYKENP